MTYKIKISDEMHPLIVDVVWKAYKSGLKAHKMLDKDVRDALLTTEEPPDWIHLFIRSRLNE